MRNILNNNIKNIFGWKSKRKLLAFAVDDYGNIRLSGLKAFENLNAYGLNLAGRFNKFDALDTKKDYDMLFDVLSSFKDIHNNPAIFTTYALPVNVDFKLTLGQSTYIPEDLDYTYARLSQEDPNNFKGAFELLHQGIENKFLRPQFHGREHLNLMTFNMHLRDKNPILLKCLEQQSLAGIPNHNELPDVKFGEAFSLKSKAEIENHKAIIKDGLARFERVYGYKPISFTPPALKLHPDLYSYVESLGIRAIDKPRNQQVNLGDGRFQNRKNKLGIQNSQNHVTIVRNCMFEPNSEDIDWVDFTFNQIKAAFLWGKPAIISSHRVNFCGLIEPNNRAKGLKELNALLSKVVKTWPEIEFVSIDQLIDIIESN
jgi:hypothetical protein